MRIVVDTGRWSDDVRLSDLEPQFVCKACAQRGAAVRPDFSGAKKRPGAR
ncbi:hypothetical protein ACFIOY_25810 [Bradyrhizobium sp. TZ2]